MPTPKNPIDVLEQFYKGSQSQSSSGTDISQNTEMYNTAVKEIKNTFIDLKKKAVDLPDWANSLR